MDHIVNNLWLGSQADADALVRQNPENITAILNVRGPDAYTPAGRNQSAEHPGKKYKYIPAPDTGIISTRHVKEAVAWLREQTDKGERILIHCKHGISRSPGFLAAFLVESGISASREEAKATISLRRSVVPATPVVEHVAPVILVSGVTGLPNRLAFERTQPSAFVAVVEVDLMKVFHECFGAKAADALLVRLAKTLLHVGLDVYHDGGAVFLCKGESSADLSAKLSEARRVFEQPFQVYGDARFQTIEGTDFSVAIAATVEEARAALDKAKRAARKESPEWLRRIVGEGGHGPGW